MKNYFLAAITMSVLLCSCTKTESYIETTENPDGTISTTTTEKNQTTTFDSVQINETVEQAKDGLTRTGQKIDTAAGKARTQLKKAGEDLKVVAEKGAQKVEIGAKKVQVDINKRRDTVR